MNYKIHQVDFLSLKTLSFLIKGTTEVIPNYPWLIHLSFVSVFHSIESVIRLCFSITVFYYRLISQIMLNQRLAFVYDGNSNMGGHV